MITIYKLFKKNVIVIDKLSETTISKQLFEQLIFFFDK